jgi:excisionase family DNA binding protein
MSGLQLSQPSSKSFLSIEEVWQVTGLSVSTVRRYVKNKRLPFAQPGGPRSRILIPISALSCLESVHETSDGTRPTDDPGPEAQAPNHEDLSRERLPGPKPQWARGSRRLLPKTGT